MVGLQEDGMANRTKILVHVRRLHTVLWNAMRQGPDGQIKPSEQPDFVHYANALYLAGMLAFLEGEDGEYSWNKPSSSHADFDSFANTHPPRRKTFSSRNITRANLNALAQIRNAVVHNDGDLSKNKEQKALAMVTAARLPGVSLNGSVITLEEELFEYVRVSTLAVRQYHGDG
jgi:hypothetical protein